MNSYNIFKKKIKKYYIQFKSSIYVVFKKKRVIDIFYPQTIPHISIWSPTKKSIQLVQLQLLYHIWSFHPEKLNFFSKTWFFYTLTLHPTKHSNLTSCNLRNECNHFTPEYHCSLDHFIVVHRNLMK